MSSSIKVEGADDLARSLRQVDDGISDLKAVHAEAAKLVEVAAVPLARRLSGRMAGSIRSSGQARQGVIRAGKASVPYAAVQHFGWPAHNITPNPYLYDALDARRDDVLDRYHDEVERLIRHNNLDD